VLLTASGRGAGGGRFSQILLRELVGDIRTHVDETDQNVDKVVCVRHQARHELRVLLGTELDELLVEQRDDLVRIGLKALQRPLEVGGVHASLASEPVLHLLGGDDAGGNLFVEEFRGLPYDLRRRRVDPGEPLLVAAGAPACRFLRRASSAGT